MLKRLIIKQVFIKAESVELSQSLIDETVKAGLSITTTNFEAWLKDDNAAVVLAYGSTERR